MKPVLITGGAKRLGAAIAQTVATNGWTPIIHYSSSHKEAVALASQTNGVCVRADLANTNDVGALISKAASKVGTPLKALVNNAALFRHDRPETVQADLLNQHLHVNMIAPVMLARAFAEQVQAGEDAVIVNIIDQKLWNTHPDFFSYTLSKAALEAATGLMAKSFAPNIRVMGVAPGYCLPAPEQVEDDFNQKAAKVNALHKRLHPEQIANTVQFCLENTALTGQTIITANGEHLVPTSRDISLQ